MEGATEIEGIDFIDENKLERAVKDLTVKALSAVGDPTTASPEALSDKYGNGLHDTPQWFNDKEKCLWRSGLRDDRYLNNLGLCRRCQIVELGTEGSGPHQSHYQLPNLKYMSLLGCRLCRLLYKGLSNIPFETMSTGFASNSVDINANTLVLQAGGPKIHFELVIPEGSRCLSEEGKHQLTFSVVDAANVKAKMTMRELLPDPAAGPTFSIAQNWLEECLATHLSCSQGNTFSLPSRVVDVTGEDPCLRTLSTTGVPYTILSHCWGGISTATTTKANLEDREQRIKFFELPKTFRDAVTVTRKLKINYLWIDSLCIIQDSLEDWETECIKMGDYYRNSRLVLSALDSDNNHQGFLNRRAGAASVELSATSRIFIRPAGIPYNEVLRNAPLSQRGWALQERLLATRILHYGKDEMFWECLGCFERERSTKKNLYPEYSRKVDYTSHEDLKCAMFSINVDPFALHSGAYARWYQIITDFSRRSLTYDSDVLPALSGLAAIIQQKTGNTYVAGLWSGDVHGLVWCKDNPERIVKHTGVLRKGRLENNCSWSWVPTRQSIRYLFNEEKRTGSIGDAVMVEYSDLCLALSAIAQPVQCVPWYEKIAPHINGFQGPDKASWRRGREGRDRDGLMLDIYNSSGSRIGIGCFDDSDNELEIHQCWAIWIAERVYEEPNQVPVVYFLLIVPVLLKTGVWKRVGMGVTRGIWAIWPFEFFPTAFNGGVRKDITLI